MENRLENRIEVNTTFKSKILTADDRIRCDTACKTLLVERIFLAWIMQHCIAAYAEIPVGVIAAEYIAGTPAVSAEPVHPNEPNSNLTGLSNAQTDSGAIDNLRDTPVIEGSGTEDTVQNEGTVYYDIKFNALVPESETMLPVIVNVEAQQSYTPGYPILKRGVYYSSRMISAQKNTVFKNTHYEKIRNVYSIWICMNAPEDLQNTITEFHTTEHPVYGSGGHIKEHYDLSSIVMVCLGDSGSNPENELLRMLDMLFIEDISPEEKCERLEQDFHIPMTETIERKVSTMCNFSEGFFQRGYKEGEATGIKLGEERGIKLGEERGIKLGEERGIKLGEERGIKLGEERGIRLGEARGEINGIRLAQDILRMNKNGYSNAQIAKEKNIPEAQVCDILQGFQFA